MLLNDRSLPNQRDGLNNFIKSGFLRLVEEKTKTIIASFLAVLPRSVLDPPALVLTSLPFYGLSRRLRSGTK